MKFLVPSWVLSVLLTVAFTRLQGASAQPGWLSIDCGAPGPYVDERGISWVSDADYMSAGSTATVSLDPSATTAQGTDLTTLRYFPDTTRSRCCYALPVKKGQPYVLRWNFLHGGYDRSPSVSFDISFDNFQKAKAVLTPSANHIAGESVFRSSKEVVYFCLFRISPTDTPFISSLELRPVDSAMYAAAQLDTCLLALARVNCGPPRNSQVRYPEDPYDRFWAGFSGPTFKTVTANAVAGSGFAVDKPPLAVMNTALTANQSFWISFTTQLYGAIGINVYLAELETLTAGQTRVFDIMVNGVVVHPNVNVYSAAQNALYKPIEYTSNATIPSGAINVSFSTAALSTMGPIVNAIEVLLVKKSLSGTFAADVLAIEGVKKSFGLAQSWTGDPCLLAPYDWLTCTNTSSPPRVTAVKLSKYNLTGSIPSGLRDLTSLTTLHLDNNKLTGPIPEFLASLPNLRELFLQNNDLSGNVPKALLSNTLLKLQIEGNPRLCVNTTCPTDGNSSNVGVIVGVVVGVLLAVGVAVGLAVYCFCFAKNQDSLENPLNQGNEGTTRGSRFTLAQVMAATKNHQKVLGKGGFGLVYYGKLANGQEVAVKVAAKGGGQGSKEFINEVDLLTRVHHKNLVSLVGYCNEGRNLILLYEYMPLGTVQEHLYGVGNKQRDSFLDWPTRLRIALQAAQGLEYLHVGCSPAIFHRDVKSNNFLLGDRMVAKVSDFGLSKSTNSKENVSHVSTMVKGTMGYLDPEYFNTNQLTEKSDVYGFGVVLLELICGRPPFIADLPENQRRIDQWVRPYLEDGEIEKIVDRTLGGHYKPESMWKVAELAMRSVEPRGIHRPRMSVIVQELRDCLEMEKEPQSATSCVLAAHEGPDPPGLMFDVVPHSSNGSSVSQFGSDTTTFKSPR